MATYVNNLRLKEIATGDESGTWGTSTNTNLELITDGFSYGTKEIAADANETFTMPDATADATRSLYLKFTSAVSLTATREITLGPNTVSKTWIIENATTGSQIITIKQGSGATVNVANGSKVMVVTDGAGAGAAVLNANPTEAGSGTVTSVGGTGTVNGITLTGTVTSSGNLTLGGTLANVDLTSRTGLCLSPTAVLSTRQTLQNVTGTLPIANGGTGTTSTTFANLTTNVTGTLPIANGGTNATTAAAAATNLGLGTASDVRFDSFGVGTNASGTTGEIRATNNVTAYYSDDRLKTKLGLIEDALEKVNSLSGFYYEANETAQALGYEVKREVGVSAQEVEAIMPEVVAPAPIDDKYLTVRYEKLIPLLVQAIKELSAKVESLESK
jgi:hypothetical protein